MKGEFHSVLQKRSAGIFKQHFSLYRNPAAFARNLKGGACGRDARLILLLKRRLISKKK
jgi:hypothetical protein